MGAKGNYVVMLDDCGGLEYVYGVMLDGGEIGWPCPDVWQMVLAGWLEVLEMVESEAETTNCRFCAGVPAHDGERTKNQINDTTDLCTRSFMSFWDTQTQSIHSLGHVHGTRKKHIGIGISSAKIH